MNMNVTFQNPELRFNTLDQPQRSTFGKTVLQLMYDQDISQLAMLEVWVKLRLTDGVVGYTVHNSLAGRASHWSRFEATLNALNIPPEEALALFCQGIVTRHSYITLVRKPVLQLTMLANGWRSIVRPHLRRLKTEKFVWGERSSIEERWVAKGLFSSTGMAKSVFYPSGNGKWNESMSAIAISALGVKPEPLCAKLLELIENHEKKPASS